ncbi:hypothetical protein YB2330_003716 [Saitoella coloradoensis]
MVSEWIAEASAFLNEAVKPSKETQTFTTSQIRSLVPSSYAAQHTDSDLHAIALYALHLLSNIQVASKATPVPSPGAMTLGMHDLMILYKLFDFLIIYCLYPCLTIGVGVSLRTRLNHAFGGKQHAPPIEKGEGKPNILEAILTTILNVQKDGGDVGTLIGVRSKYMLDVLAGCGELAFNPAVSETRKAQWTAKFNEILESLDAQALITMLTSLLHAQCPTWFRTVLAEKLSMISVRPRGDGVQSVVSFVLGLRTGEDVSLEKVTRAAKLICAIPKTMSGDDYYSIVCPQLLGMLDLPGDKTPMPRVSAQIIAQLNSTVPEVARRYIIQPVHQPLLAPANEELLRKAISRLTVLVVNPDFVLTEKLIQPVLLELWGLLLYAHKTNRSKWEERAQSLILVHVKTTGGAKAIVRLLQNITYVSGPTWEFGPGSEGGIDIRPATIQREVAMDEIDGRVEAALDLLKRVETVEGLMSEVLLALLRLWLSAGEESGSSDPVAMVATLRLLQETLDRFGESALKKPRQIIELVKGVLDEFVEKTKASHRQYSPAIAAPSLSGLGSIVQGQDSDDEDEDKEGDGQEGDSDTVGLAISLLTAILGESEDLSAEELRFLGTTASSLDFISQNYPNPLLAAPALNLKTLIAARTSVSDDVKSTLTAEKTSVEKYAEGLQLLQDPLVPVRAHGMQMLRDLVDVADPVVDVNAVLSIFTNLVRDEDSFIYLNAIKGLSALTYRYGIDITRHLLQAYAESSEQWTVDARLRVGEALLRTIQGLGAALVGDVATDIARVLLDVSARRKETSKDVRLRASALSILGMAVETNATGMGQWCARAIEAALAILQLERSEDAVTVRRASVVLIAGVLKGISAVAEFPAEHLKDMQRIITYVEATDSDELVRVQARGALNILHDMISGEFRLEESTSVLRI